MGCVRRLFMFGTVVIQVATFGFVLLLTGSAGVLGEAAIIASSDAIAAFILAAVAGVLTLVQILVLWQGGRARRRLETEVISLRATAQRPAMPVKGTPDPTSPVWTGPRGPQPPA